jgi:hypothetical protein
MLTSLIGAAAAAVVGLLLAVAGTFTVVQLSADAKPDPVDKPLVVYGNR